MVKTTIKAGVCGFTTTVTARSDDLQHVAFQIESDCENVRRLATGLPAVDGYEEVGAGFDGVIYREALGVLKGCCAGCVVPCGIFKSMQVAAGLALPAAASMEFETCD